MPTTNANQTYYDGVILQIVPIQHRFKPDGPDFELQVTVRIMDQQTKQPKADVLTYLDFSSDYGVGMNSTKIQAQISMETLAHLGFQGQDLSQLNTLINKPCRVLEKTADKNGNAYSEPRYYLTSSRPVVAINNAAERLASLMNAVGGGSMMGQQQQPPAVGNTTQVPQFNPFAK